MINSWKKACDNFKAKMIGKLLGDGCITKQEGRKPRFQFIHAASDLGWSTYCYLQLKEHIPLNPPKYKISIDKRLKKGYSSSHYTQSKTSPIVTYLHRSWYKDRKKVLPFHLISEYFNLESLAWWYMDDGHLTQKNDKPLKVILSTDNFTTDENKWLISYLKEKFDLLFQLDKQNRLILYDQFQIFYFLYLVTPFMHDSMHRKIISKSAFYKNSSANRTTLYLPTNISVTSPTSEINHVLKSLKILIQKYKTSQFFPKYVQHIHSLKTIDSKAYQIVINPLNMSNLYFLKANTGLSYSMLCRLCFLDRMTIT